MILWHDKKEKEEDWWIFTVSLYSSKDTGGLICSIFAVRRMRNTQAPEDGKLCYIPGNADVHKLCFFPSVLQNMTTTVVKTTLRNDVSAQGIIHRLNVTSPIRCVFQNDVLTSSGYTAEGWGTALSVWNAAVWLSAAALGKLPGTAALSSDSSWSSLPSWECCAQEIPAICFSPTPTNVPGDPTSLVLYLAKPQLWK